MRENERVTEMTAEDYDSVERAQQVMQERWRPASLNAQVDAWACLVQEIEDGYSMTVDDYTNDLSVREWLDQVRPMLTEHVRNSLSSRLAPLDERFDEATAIPSRPLPGCGTGRWCRVPRRLIGELREDALKMNFAPSAT